MDRYTIHCTATQTKKALALGAPVVLRSEYYKPQKHDLKLDAPIPCKQYTNGYCYACCPTTDQMIGWLEDKGLLISITARNTPDNPIYNYNINKCEESWNTFPSRKEATLKSIDVALEYLRINKK